jgi:hypothetical protein
MMLGDTKDVARHRAASVGESEERAVIVNAAEENRANYCKVLNGRHILVPCIAFIK